MSKALIALSDVSLSYDQTPILEGVTLSVNPQDFILLTGPNGGGKTTLIRLMLDLLKPTTGHITRIPHLVMGYLPQYQKLDKQFPISVLDVVLSGMLARKANLRPLTSDQYDMAHALLERMQLGEYSHHAISQLSGGQLQRVLFARAVASNPDILILDEPDTYLDKSFKNILETLLNDYAQRCAIVLVTHNPHGIERLATTIYRIDRTVKIVDTHWINADHAGHCPGD